MSVKKFGKLAQYKMYMKLMKEDNVLDKNDENPDELVNQEDNIENNDVHSKEEEIVNKPEPGVFSTDNPDIQKIHDKLMHEYKPSQLIYDNKE